MNSASRRVCLCTASNAQGVGIFICNGFSAQRLELAERPVWLRRSIEAHTKKQQEPNAAKEKHAKQPPNTQLHAPSTRRCTGLCLDPKQAWNFDNLFNASVCIPTGLQTAGFQKQPESFAHRPLVRAGITRDQELTSRACFP